MNTIGGWLLVGGFITLVCLRVPVMFAIGFSTVVTILYLDIPIVMMISQIIRGLNSFSLMAIPFFILAGEIMGTGGISDRLVRLSKSMVGQFRGGLAHVNCLGSMFFGGISGSPAADVSSIGAILIDMMERDGYDTDFSTGVTMASSIQGLLIPPSHNMIIYAMAAGGSVSIAKLFMGGLVPGIMLGLILMVFSYFVSVKRNYPKGDAFNFRFFLSSAKESVLGLLTIVIILVGVLTGVFTATESAAIAVLWAIIVTFFVYREIPLSAIWGILEKALYTLARIMAIIGISSAFGWVLAYLKIPNAIVTSITGVTDNPIVIMILMNVILLFLGMIMDMSSLIIIATPILLPIATSIGIDPVHFGVIMMLNLGIGLITPPVGGVLFVCSGITNLPMERLTKAMIPFYAVLLFGLILITYVPAISMTVVNLLY